VKRIAKREIGVRVKIVKFLGFYEYINNDPRGHLVALAFIVKRIGGKIKKNRENSDFKYFKKIPKDMIYYQKKILRDALNER